MPQFSVIGSGSLDLTAQDFTGFDGIIWNTNGDLIVELNNERFVTGTLFGNLPTDATFTGHLAFVDTLRINIAANATFAASSLSFTQWTPGVDAVVFYDAGNGSENITGTNVDDRFIMTGGNDIVNGLGLGTDTLVLNYASFATSFSMSAGNTAITNFSGTSVSFSNIERFDLSLGSGNDSVILGNGDDIVNGGIGADTLNTAQGAAIVDGGSGNDRWAADFSNTSTPITVNLNLPGTQNIGNGTTLTSIEMLTLTGSTGADVITSVTNANPDDQLNDIIQGDAGNDIITVGGGIDVVNGGAEDDLLIIDFSADDDAFSMSTGNTVITDFSNTAVTFSNIERFDYRGGSSVDNIILGAGFDIASGGAGADILNTFTGGATVDGGIGDDRWSADLSTFSTAFTINLNTPALQNIGNGSSLTSIEMLTLTGSTAADVIASVTNANPDAQLNDTINGNDGNDTITVGGGLDVVDGGANDDLLIIDFSADDDAFNMSSGNTVITDFSNTRVAFTNIERFDYRGGSNVDNIILGTGFDIASGGAGADVLNTLTGGASVNGGIGDDRWAADLSTFATAFTINLNTAALQNIGNGSSLTSIEMLTLTGSTGNDVIASLTNANPDAQLNDTINGGFGNDTITVGGGIDIVDGGADDDLLIIDFSADDDIFNMSTNNTVITDFSNTSVTFANIERFDYRGGSSVDNIILGAGFDIANGGAGADTLNTVTGGASVNGGSGDDRWAADLSTFSTAFTINLNNAVLQNIGNGSSLTSIEMLTLTGSTGNDVVATVTNANPDAQLNDIINGNDGNDTITVGGGLDVVNGGADDDLLIIDFSADDDAFSMSSGNTVITDFSNTNVAFSNIERFDYRGGSNSDNIVLGNGDDIARGGLGSNTFNGGAGNDTIDWRLATGAISVTLGLSGNATVSVAGLGTDTISNFENILSGSGNDTLVGNAVANVLSGGDGADHIDGGGDTDVADYRTSATGQVSINLLLDTATGGQATGDTLDNIEGLWGSLTLRDVLVGDNNTNVIKGFGGNDSLRGGGGDDFLEGGAGADAINGDAGTSDTASYRDSSSGTVSINLLTSTYSGGDAQGDTLFFIENLEGSLTLRDILVGNDIANRIFGNGGNDSIRGEGGNDFIDGGAGGDSLNAGAGIDTLSYEKSSAGVTIDLNIAAQTSGGDAAGDVLNFFENVNGSAFADNMRGNYQANRLVGGAGSDTLDGGTGSDFLTGGADADTFRFTDTGFGTDQILDWQDSIDHISIALPLETTFAGLIITGNGSTDVTVKGFNGGGAIIVHSAVAVTLDAGDFIFI